MHVTNPESSSPTKQLSLFRAALAGTAADLGASFVALGFLLAFSLAGSLVSAIVSGSSPRPEAFVQSGPFLAISILVAALGSLLGGFVAGRLYSGSSWAVGLLVGLLSCVSALLLSPVVRDPSPVQPSEIAGFGLAVLASVCGAFLGSKHPVSINGHA